MVTINTSYYCPRITSMHTTPSVSLQGKRITKPRASIPPCWWGSSNHPNPMPEGILTTIKPTGHLFFFSLRPSQPGFCVCSAFPRKGHYVNNKHPSAILLHVCGHHCVCHLTDYRQVLTGFRRYLQHTPREPSCLVL